MRLFLIVLLALLSGCVTSVCVDNLNISEENLIPYPDRPALSSPTFDRTISYHAEPYVLKAFEQGDEYYVEFYPVRGQSRLHGPFQGNFSERVQC